MMVLNWRAGWLICLGGVWYDPRVIDPPSFVVLFIEVCPHLVCLFVCSTLVLPSHISYLYSL